jgi:L-gulonate 3-dehydrogenase
MPHAAMIGAGLIGRSWAMVFARAGWDVTIYDAAEGAADQALGLIAAGLAEQAEYGLVSDAQAAAKRVRPVRDLRKALDGASFVQENAPETVDAKRPLFRELDRLAAPDVILASSTSAIVASRFTEDLPGRARCLVAHPVNPPHLVPVVELSGAPWTAADTVERARSVFEGVGQVAVTVKREIEGFILNRLQGALLSEAVRLVRDGYVSPDDLDKTVRDGLGLRWSFMGPFETIELNAPGGIPDYCKRYGPFYGRLLADPPDVDVWSEAALGLVMRERVETPPERLPAKHAWRDRRLMALIAHKRLAAEQIKKDRERD